MQRPTMQPGPFYGRLASTGATLCILVTVGIGVSGCQTSQPYSEVVQNREFEKYGITKKAEESEDWNVLELMANALAAGLE